MKKAHKRGAEGAPRSTKRSRTSGRAAALAAREERPAVERQRECLPESLKVASVLLGYAGANPDLLPPPAFRAGGAFFSPNSPAAARWDAAVMPFFLGTALLGERENRWFDIHVQELVSAQIAASEPGADGDGDGLAAAEAVQAAIAAKELEFKESDFGELDAQLAPDLLLTMKREPVDMFRELLVLDALDAEATQPPRKKKRVSAVFEEDGEEGFIEEVKSRGQIAREAAREREDAARASTDEDFFSMLVRALSADCATLRAQIDGLRQLAGQTQGQRAMRSSAAASCCEDILARKVEVEEVEAALLAVGSSIWAVVETRMALHELRLVKEVSAFNGTNPDFLLRNPDFLMRNVDFLLRNVDFIMKRRRRTACSG